jgi:hypothetical protein
MRIVLIAIFILSGCAHTTKKKDSPPELVSLNAALNQAQMSYMRGCVEAMKTIKLVPSFPECKEKAITHRLELQSIMDFPK